MQQNREDMEKDREIVNNTPCNSTQVILRILVDNMFVGSKYLTR